MNLALILVHFHTPELAERAVRALRQNLAELPLESEILLVDNGSTASERERLQGLGVRLIEPGRNLGFSGGVNLGAANTRAETLVFMNPDVLVQPGCLAALHAELGAGADVAGPRFYWDEACTLMLPPTERIGRWDEILRARALRSGGAARRARRRWRRHARRHWRAVAPLRSYSLSGGLLAVKHSAWERVGKFDEDYPLYFEETDWLKRSERLGLAAAYVPAAGAVHLHGESARREPKSAEWFEAGAQRFRRLYYGAWFTRALATLAAGRDEEAADSPSQRSSVVDLRSFAEASDLWVEVSPRRVGFPAAARHFQTGVPQSWTLPADVAARLDGAELVLRVVDSRGVERRGMTLSAGA